MTVIGKSIRFFLQKGFDIREGEYLRASLMQVYIFLIITVLLMVKPTVNSLFISTFGVENLPIAFIWVAIFAIVVSVVYTRLLSRIQLNKIIQGTLLVSVITLIVFGVLVKFNIMEELVLYLFYIWVSIFGVLSASQFWILANMVFNPREAKRLFGFVGAGAIAGGIFGGYMTTLLANLIGSEYLIYVAALFLSVCIPVVARIWKTHAASTQTVFLQKRKIETFSDHPFKLIRNSKHLTFLAAIIGISVIVAKLVEYQFSAISSAAIPDQDELTAFFGFWYSTLNLISLLVQLFLTRKVVGTLGIGTSLFFLPGGILLGAVILLFLPVLWAGILIKVFDGSLKQSINKAAIELLGLPIPQEVKNRTKTFIDVFVDSVATGIGGAILIFFVKGMDLSTRWISVIIIALLGLWIYFAIRVRKEYLHSFKLKLEEARGKKIKKPLKIDKESVLGGLAKVLEAGGEKQQLFALSKARELGEDRLFEKVKPLLDHTSAIIRTEALRTLYFFKKQKIVDKATQMIHDPSHEVRVAALEYLIENSPEPKEQIIVYYLHNEDYKIRGSALASLAIEARDNLVFRKSLDLEGRISGIIDSLPSLAPEEKRYTHLQVLKAIGRANLIPLFPFIRSSFENKDPDIVNEAILSAGWTLNPQFTQRLMRFLENKVYKESAKKALLRFGPGILPMFAATLKEPGFRVETCRMLPFVAEGINSQKSVDFLFGLLEYKDFAVGLEALRSLNNLKVNLPDLRFHEKQIAIKILEEVDLYQDTLSALYAQTNSQAVGTGEDEKSEVRSQRSDFRSEDSGQADNKPGQDAAEARQSLIALLGRRLDGSLERIFRLLGLKYSPSDIITIYNGIQSEKPDIRLNAVEYLDNLLDANLKKVLIPIIETTMVESLSEEAIKSLGIAVPGEYECFSLLLEGKDTKMKMAVLYLIGRLKDPKYRELVLGYVNSPNPKVRKFAEDALGEISRPF